MRRPLRDAGALLAIALLTGALLLFALLYQREAALRSGEELTAALTRVIAEQTGRTLQSADQALRLSAARLEALGVARTLDADTARAALDAELQGLPFLGALWVLDAQGRRVFDSRGAGEGQSFADRDYFQAFRRDPSLGFYVGTAIRSRVSGRWMISVARPIRDPDGRLRQVIVGAMEPRYFEQLWSGIDVGLSGVVALYHRSGQMLARTPVEERLRGADFSHLSVFEALLRAPEGSYLRVSPVDGVQRLLAYRQLPVHGDLVVVVGSGYDELLGPWRRFAALTALVWGAAVVIAVLLTLQLRRQAHERLDTELRFRQLAQAMPQIVFIADERGGVSFVNQRWVEVTGRSPDEALGSHWQQVVHPDDRAGMALRLGDILRTGQELQLEHRLLYRDGSYRWQLLRAVPVQQPGRPGLSWFGTATDIDALKRAQQRLHAQAEQLHLAGQLTRMGYWRADLATRRVSLSAEAASILDLAPDSEPVVQEMVAMFAPHSLETGLQALRRATDRGEPFDLEVEMITQTGRHVWIRSIGEPVRDEQGRLVAVHGAQQDITLRVLMMEEIRRLNASLEERIAQRTSELARQEALFRTLTEQAPLPIWTVDLQGSVTFFSRAWYALAGGAPPQWLGDEWMRAIHPDDVLPMQQNWIRSAATGEPCTGTRRIRSVDGTYHTTTYRAVPVRGEGAEAGEILFWVGVDADVTDLMANEAALRLANTQLEAFSYSVSHDLQSPLQRVSSYARLLQQELAQQPAGPAQHYAARIVANADAMSQLIQGLLALAHVSQVALIRTTVNLSDLAVDILQQLEAGQPQRRVRWSVEPGLVVLGDTRLMRSVMENLIGNAWKFTAREPQAEIVVGGSRERGEYFVRDNGCGFDMAYADRLFGTFQRLHGDDEFPGTGIGLATVARAIVRQGGRVWAQSAPGEGATFHFTLPTA